MKKKATPASTPAPPGIPIREIRGQRVLPDTDLAAIYGVPTKVLNQAVRRNAERFPADFVWRLTAEEWSHLTNRSQIVTGSPLAKGMRSQSVTGSQRHRDPRHLPFAFTEHGALQAANVLRSARAVAMGVFVLRAFLEMRATFLQSDTLSKKLAELDQRLSGRPDTHENAIVEVMHELVRLLNPPAPPPRPPKPRIGFKP